MALISLDISSYNIFRSQVLNRAAQNLGYDVDNFLGYQCWDLAAEVWMNIPEFSGLGLYPQTGPSLYASECWTYSRTNNAGTSFDLIYNLAEVKRGDCIVIASSPISYTGHIAFADEDYNGTAYMNLLGQNQVDPSPEYGHIPTVTNLDVGSYFLGAFRYHEWQDSPVPPPILHVKKGKFPWVLYARRLRNKH